MIENGKKYLVTADNWFEAPDGETYKAAWGICHVRRIEDVLGFTPVRPSTNWYIEIGSEQKGMIIAGCRVHFIIRCEEKPVIHKSKYIEKDTGIDKVVNRIYIAE